MELDSLRPVGAGPDTGPVKSILASASLATILKRFYEVFQLEELFSRHITNGSPWVQQEELWLRAHNSTMFPSHQLTPCWQVKDQDDPFWIVLAFPQGWRNKSLIFQISLVARACFTCPSRNCWQQGHSDSKQKSMTTLSSVTFWMLNVSAAATQRRRSKTFIEIYYQRQRQGARIQIMNDITHWQAIKILVFSRMPERSTDVIYGLHIWYLQTSWRVLSYPRASYWIVHEANRCLVIGDCVADLL